MEALNLTQIIAEFGTTGLLVAAFVVIFKTALPMWIASLEKLNATMQEVKTEVQAVKSSTDKLLNFHTNGRK